MMGRGGYFFGRAMRAHENIRVLLFDHHEDAFPLLRDQACDDFLSHVFRGIVEKLLELHAREALDDVFFAPDGRRVLTLELVQLVLFLEHIFDQSSTPIGHFTKSVSESPVQLISRGPIRLLAVNVGHVPHVVSDELLHSAVLIPIDGVLVEAGQGLSKAGNVLDQDVISRDHHLRLFRLL